MINYARIVVCKLIAVKLFTERRYAPFALASVLRELVNYKDWTTSWMEVRVTRHKIPQDRVETA